MRRGWEWCFIGYLKSVLVIVGVSWKWSKIYKFCLMIGVNTCKEMIIINIYTYMYLFFIFKDCDVYVCRELSLVFKIWFLFFFINDIFKNN